MKIQVKVMLDVDAEGNHSRTNICESVADAVMEALWYRRDDGFRHDLEEDISITPDYATASIVE